ncbi:three-helix bundle dimerization domain-containing protein [Dactylosporangium cerinum]|uniref:Three-helix bundle dimerization domain-containing protein n=1 Tax=Dactylosporangium cerinum TaxID=1434730 RepID=A0ABV9WID6_9ACTN
MDTPPRAEGPLTPEERQALRRVTETLHGRFPSADHALIADLVERARARYADAPIRDFVPVMIERLVAAELAGNDASSTNGT